jgi:hypothetical protein
MTVFSLLGLNRALLNVVGTSARPRRRGWLRLSYLARCHARTRPVRLQPINI